MVFSAPPVFSPGFLEGQGVLSSSSLPGSLPTPWARDEGMRRDPGNEVYSKFDIHKNLPAAWLEN